MRLYPAIDIRGGKCVRLRQGDYSQETVFGDDPVAVASRWAREGAKRLHLVDLDGAKAGEPRNRDMIAGIVAAVDVPCQVGGGLRDEASLMATFELGAAACIVGTKALKDPAWFSSMANLFAGRLILGLDAKEGMVATAGWLEVSSAPALDVVKRFDDLPLAAIVYTDIAKDGMLAGPNGPQTAAIQAATRHPVIASGGISSVDDILDLARMGIGGCILGRCLYEGTVHLATAFEYLERHGFGDAGVGSTPAA